MKGDAVMNKLEAIIIEVEADVLDCDLAIKQYEDKVNKFLAKIDEEKKNQEYLKSLLIQLKEIQKTE